MSNSERDMAERRSRSVMGKVARVFERQPDRVAAAWRRLRFAEGRKGDVPDNLLDDVVESFVRELGVLMGGTRGSPWARTRGVLRLSPERGLRALYEEFWALRRCLFDAADVLGGGPPERAVINQAVDEAVESTVALYEAMSDPLGLPAGVPFGGVVVEYFERPSAGAEARPAAAAG